MNVLSLFNGMGCLEIALIEEGIKYDTMYTSEVDKHALNQTRLNFPNNIELGDVRNIDVSKLKPIDFLAGGSPCQSFSFAGKRNGMSTKCEIDITTLDQYLTLKSEGFEFEGQSYLFWEYMRILTDIRKYNPNVLFLLENVEMGAKWERVLSNAIGVFGVHINSTLVSAQNRKRIYWTNIRTKQVGLFDELHSDIPQPKDERILLRDILENDVPEKYYIKNSKMLEFVTSEWRQDKLYTQINGEKALPQMARQYASWCGDYVAGGNHSDMDLICELTDRHERNLKGLDEKANAFLSTSWKGAQANGTTLVPQNYRIRRLTPAECAKLQTVPEWYKWGCSDTQAYKMLGNGWTIKVIQHILSFL